MKNNQYLREFLKYCLDNGIDESLIFNKENYRNFAATSMNGYEGYSVFTYTTKGKFKLGPLTKMLSIDLKSRLNHTTGIASKNFESVLLFEPPQSKPIGMFQYIRCINPLNLHIFLNRTTSRQTAYEKYARKIRTPFMDDKTIYLYVFSTKKDMQRKGFGKPLMNFVIKYAKEYGYNLILETDSDDNVPLYERFGFTLVSSTIYKKQLHHYVMVMKNN